MKKFLLMLGAAVALTAGLASCSKDSKKDVSAADKAFGDSIATSLGTFMGQEANLQYDRMAHTDSAMLAKYKKDSFLRGLKHVLDSDTTDVAYYEGLYYGVRLLNYVTGITNTTPYPVDKDEVFKAFKESYLQDSVGDRSAAYAQYNMVMMELQKRIEERHQQELAESPEAKANLEAGVKYQAEKVAEGYTKTESGLVYNMTNEGAAPKITPNDMVTLTYTLKTIDGTVLQTNRGNERAMRASGFVPGFIEAISLMGKGGEMTALIPAELGYGLNAPGEGIGPNQTLVFDIAILDVTPAELN